MEKVDFPDRGCSVVHVRAGLLELRFADGDVLPLYYNNKDELYDLLERIVQMIGIDPRKHRMQWLTMTAWLL